MAPRTSKPAGFSIRVKASEAEILLYEEIDSYYGIGAKAFREALKEAGDVSQIKVRINSPGGNIFEGLAIYNSLKTHPAHKVVMIDGVALSMASVVAMAGDEIEIADNGFVMVHNPMNWTAGDSEDMRQMAELLDKLKAQLVAIYAARTKQESEAIAAWMDAETWMTASEAVDRGFADRSTEALAVAAAFDTSRFTNVPANFRGEAKMPEPTPATPASAPATPAAPVAASYAEIKAACTGADADFICSQLEQSATIDQARNAWMAEQSKRLTAKEAELAQAKAAAAKPPAPGVAPLGDAGAKKSDDAGDPLARWNELVDGYAKTTGDRGKAISMAVRKHPEAHRDYLVAFNAERGRQIDR